MLNKIGIYFKETRPHFLLLTPVCVSVGLAIAVLEKGSFAEINWFNFILILIGALCSHITVNVLNDYFDYKSGLDLITQRTPFNGGSGIIPQGLLTTKQVFIMGMISLLITILIGIYLLYISGPGLLLIGLAGIIIVLVYTPLITKSPALCLIAPGVGFGLLMVTGTSYVLTGHYSIVAFLSSLIPTFLVSNLLLINQFPDKESDSKVGRFHFPIKIGRKKSAYIYATFSILTYLVILSGVILKLFPWTALIAIITFPLAIITIRGTLIFADNIPKLIPYLGKNIIYTLLTPLIFSISIILY